MGVKVDPDKKKRDEENELLGIVNYIKIYNNMPFEDRKRYEYVKEVGPGGNMVDVDIAGYLKGNYPDKYRKLIDKQKESKPDPMEEILDDLIDGKSIVFKHSSDAVPPQRE